MARWSIGQLQPANFWWFQIQMGIVGLGSGYYYLEYLLRIRVHPTRAMKSVSIRWLYQAVFILLVAFEVKGLRFYVEVDKHQWILSAVVTSLGLASLLWFWVFWSFSAWGYGGYKIGQKVWAN